MRAYNPDSATYKTLATAATKESSTGACTGLVASVQAVNGASSPVGIAPVAWWRLNGDATDSSGYGNDGTVIGASLSTGQDGTPNSAYSFNGSSSQITIPDSPILSPTSAITLSAWARPNTNKDQGIVSKDVSVGIDNPPYAIQLVPTGFAYSIITNSVNTPMAFTCSEISSSSGAWYFIVMTYDGTTQSLYVNGVKCSDTRMPSDMADTSGLLRIGQQKTGLNRWFNGSIDDVRIYNTSISSGAILTLYQAGAQ
jgi:hypothetical protein